MLLVRGHKERSERPERSRNAKAQMVQREKRKAYVEQLEETVTKLQTALDYLPEHFVMPPPLKKIRLLEQENARLLRENHELHRILSGYGARAPPFEVYGRNLLTPFNGPGRCDPAPDERRKMNALDDLHIASRVLAHANLAFI
ncbi:hypothetical protein DFH07DRAFT_738123 [Mycena maculata]|uniref:BZIP domain-containing protein n=1 Tax=Mycena maculata TaxID=230809 RepID=A0AAD7JH08_9AGAR|nr:hypothetical protein DFH07DRAFT_738123 [Mycena maculata]